MSFKQFSAMKVIVVAVLLFVMCPAIMAGQMINHFNLSDAKWNVAKTVPMGSPQFPNFAATTTTVYGIQGDSLVNGEVWCKLFSSNDSLFQNNLVFCGLVKSINNTVLFINAQNILDTLYDFNLNVGDSVLYDLYNVLPNWIKVVTIDSVLLNGAYYKRLKFSEPALIAFDYLNEVWIEGVGSIHGPLFPNAPVKFTSEAPDSMLLTCSSANTQLVWQHIGYSGCFVNNILGVASPEIATVKLFPNPSIGIINIECNSNNKYLFELISC